MSHLSLVSSNSDAALSDILTPQQILLLAVRFNGWNLAEVGALLGVTPMSVRSSEAKAMHLLRQQGWTNDDIAEVFKRGDDQ
jgi:hypothetical protein